MAPATQPEAEAVRIEVLGKAWKPGCMMRSYKPSRHPVAARDQLRNPSVDVIPRHPPGSSLAEHELVFCIELAQIMKCGRDLNVRNEIRRRVATEAKHAFGTLPRPNSNASDVPFVEVRFRVRSWRRMR